MSKKTIITWLIIPVFITFSGNCYAQKQPSTNEKINNAYSEIIGNNYESAKKILNDVINDDPGNLNAHLYLGLLSHKIGVYDNALVEYFKVLQKDKNNLMLNYNLGLLYQEMNSFQKSLEFYLKVIKSNPDFPDVYFNVARIYQELGNKPQETISLYEKYLKFKPDDLDALNNLGVMYKSEGNYDKSSELFSKIMDIDPSYVPARYNMALLYLVNGNNKELNKELKLIKAMSADHAKILELQIAKFKSNI